MGLLNLIIIVYQCNNNGIDNLMYTYLNLNYIVMNYTKTNNTIPGVLECKFIYNIKLYKMRININIL